MHIDRVMLIGGVGALWVLPAWLCAQGAPADSIQPAPTSRPSGEVFSPHGSTRSCNECHAMRGKDVLPIAKEDIDRICLGCHDGRLAHAERHPIGRPIPTDGVVLPKGWPALNGKIGCLTCHDLKLSVGHGGTGEPPPDNPDVLRGPPMDTLAFCTQCHTGNARQHRHNPHRQLNPQGQIQEQSCLFCHTRKFSARELQDRSGKPELKADAITLCIGCHTRHIDFFEPGHIGRTATPEIVAHMAAADHAPQGRPVTPADVKTAQERQERPLRLPLGPGNIVMCSTCHNPHQSGVFPASSVLNLGALPFGPHSSAERKSTNASNETAARPVSTRPSADRPGHQSSTSDHATRSSNAVTRSPHDAAQRPFNVPLRMGANLCGECHGK